MTPRGGARPGSGPKPSDPSGSGRTVGARIPPATYASLVEWAKVRGLTVSAAIAVIVAAALVDADR